MRLLRLTMRAFRTYRTETVLDLASIGAAVIRGDNGVGKSSIAEAIEWALFGTSRSASADKIITLGEMDCCVELLFAVADRAYLIKRMRSRKGRGSGSLHLFLRSVIDTVESFEALDGKTSKDTQAMIVDIIGIGRDALLASAMIKQGEASRFTKAGPTERRGLLRQLAGLGRFEVMAKEASTRLADAATARDEAAEATASATTATADCDHHRALEGAATEAAASAEKVLESLASEMELSRSNLANARASVAAQAAASDRDVTIVARLARLGVSKTRIAGQISDVEAIDLSVFGAAEREAGEAKAEIANLEELDAKARERGEEITTLLVEDTTLRADWKAAAAESKAPASSVPWQRAADTMALLQKPAAVLDQVPCAVTGRWARGDEWGIWDVVPDVDLAGACPLLKQANEAKAELVQIEPDRDRLAACVEAERETATGEMERVKAVGKIVSEKLAALRLLPTSATIQRQLGAARTSLSTAEARSRGREAAELRLEGLPGLRDDLAEIEIEQDALQDERAGLGIDSSVGARVSGLEDDVARMERGQRRCRQELTEAGETAAANRAVAASLEDACAALKPAQAALAKHTAEAEDWGATVQALKLAPTLLLENFAIPTIEAEANRLLAQIGGGMSLRLDTQKVLADGKSQRETLDLAVQTERGELLYEDLSGGQQFRVDIAVCLAQSALLSEREGVPVNWLIIDEGWGALDGAGRDALKDVVTGLQSLYDLLLVITHVEDVGECLPTQIWIEDSPEGAKVVYR